MRVDENESKRLDFEGSVFMDFDLSRAEECGCCRCRHYIMNATKDETE